MNLSWWLRVVDRLLPLWYGVRALWDAPTRDIVNVAMSLWDTVEVPAELPFELRLEILPPWEYGEVVVLGSGGPVRGATPDNTVFATSEP